LKLFRTIFGKRKRKNVGVPVPQEWFVGRSRISVGPYTTGTGNLDIRQWDEGAELVIGKFCSIATKVTVMLGGNHRTDWITTYQFGRARSGVLGGQDITGQMLSKGNITIGNDVWLGSGARIMSGVTVHDGAVIAADAVVTRDVAAYTIVGGNPARVIRTRFPPDIVDLLLQLGWWDLPSHQIQEIMTDLCAAPREDALRDLIARYRS
jgi:acetyltransferase-like isoleucine patch superfamily enzyme